MGIEFKVKNPLHLIAPQRARVVLRRGTASRDAEQAWNHAGTMVPSAARSCLGGLGLLLLFDLEEKCAVDVGENASEGNRSPDKGVELFVAANGELEMAGGYALDLEVLGRVLRWSAFCNTQLVAASRHGSNGNLLLQARGLRQ